MRKLILYIAVSLDGKIASEDDNLDFLKLVERPGEDYGYEEFLKSIDTVILGRRTFDKLISFGLKEPYPGKKCFVLTRNPRSAYKNFEFYNGDLAELISTINREEGLNIFLDGGSQVTNQFIRLNLIDEYIVSIIPVILGKGIPLFEEGLPNIQLKFIGSRNYESGLVLLRYKR
jgi:dihydrofolate reductase